MGMSALDQQLLSSTAKVSIAKSIEDGSSTLQVYFTYSRKKVSLDGYTAELINLKNSTHAPAKFGTTIQGDMIYAVITKDTMDRDFIGLVYNKDGLMVKGFNFRIKK